MLKNISKLELTIGDKLYHFLCDQDSPIENVKEALCQFIKYAGNIEDHIKAAQAAEEAKKKQDAPTPNVTEHPKEIVDDQPTA